jgi:hypothetical protein
VSAVSDAVVEYVRDRMNASDYVNVCRDDVRAAIAALAQALGEEGC